jgi:hypothetical protein
MLWCALRDTYGVPLPSKSPIAVALSTYPALRGLSVGALAARLEISPDEAQHGIATYVAETFGAGSLIVPGESLDLCVMRQGRPAPAVHLTKDERGRLGTSR